MEHHSFVERLALLLQRRVIILDRIIDFEVTLAVHHIFDDFTERILLHHPADKSIGWLFTEVPRLRDVSKVALGVGMGTGVTPLPFHRTLSASLELRWD